MKGKNKLILEFTEFNNMRLNPETATYAMPNVTNKQLSVDAFDKHQDAIRASIDKLNNIVGSLSNSSTFGALRGKLALENQNIQYLKIIRLVKSGGINWNAYISFVIDNYEYWGVIKNVLDRNPEFTSEVFKDFDLIQTKEWVIKIKGLIVKTIKKWLHVEPGEYLLVNDEVYAYNNETGDILRIEKDADIEVIRSYDNKINIKYKDNFYTIKGEGFVYFNYWFLKKGNE